MNKVLIKKIALIFLILLWCVIVFKFSSQQATDSDKTSDVFTGIFTETPNSEVITNNYNEEKYEFISVIVRKTAHFTLFTLGGILIYLYINEHNLIQSKKIIKTQAFGTLYAISDEIHQYFVPGRSSSIIDVLIDSAGIIFGVCIVLIAIKIKNSILKRQV